MTVSFLSGQQMMLAGACAGLLRLGIYCCKFKIFNQILPILGALHPLNRHLGSGGNNIRTFIKQPVDAGFVPDNLGLQQRV